MSTIQSQKQPSSSAGRTRRSRRKGSSTRHPQSSAPIPKSVSVMPEHSEEDSHSSRLSPVLPDIPQEVYNSLLQEANPKSFPKDSRFLRFLQEEVGLESPFLNRLKEVGWVTPSEIVNLFGRSNNSIVESYIKLGYVHVLPQEQHHATTRLLIFARGQTLKSKVQMTPKQQRKGWDSFKVGSSFDNIFEGWSESRQQQCSDTLDDPNLLINARHVMKRIRNSICHKIREWYENYQTSTINLNLNANRTDPSPDTDTIHSLKEIENRLEQTLSKRLEDTITMSLKKEIQSLKDMMSHKEEDSHISPRNMGDDLSMAGDGVPRIHDDDDDDLYARLPRTSSKLRPNRRSSFYQRGRKPAARPFKSPLDPDFNMGCNDDLLSETSSVTSEANTSIRNLKKETRNWKLKQQREVAAKLDRPCSDDLRLKRAPLPTSITWNGNAGKPLEDYISKFKGHVAQQDRLGYILKDELHRLWVKHGDPKRVLLIGIRTRRHPFLSFISVKQFLFNIAWLYGALQQSPPGKGSTIVKSYERSQDGILVWKKFLATYRHGGNVAVYLNQQQSLLQKEYHLQYPGGMLQFVEDFETAFTNIDAVCAGNPEMAQKNVGLYTDQGKRELFISKFSTGPGTMDMIEAVESTTTTWPDMVDALRQRIARRIGTQQQVATKRAHLVQEEENPNNNPPISRSVVNSMETGEKPETTALVNSFLSTMDGPSIMSFVYSVAQDWNVGNQLWPHLPQQVKDQIIAIRKEQRPAHSGGDLDLTLVMLL